jgi:methylenetetrahydrofolate dehydrogenase (NADP+)/methenyltetrahydrofolate cyclohydrolase
MPVSLIELPADTNTEAITQAVRIATKIATGVVVQLPLPPQIDREVVLAAIPVTHDPDGFLYGTDKLSVLPPVVAAIAQMCHIHEVSVDGKSAVVLGAGRLVGAPAAVWLQAHGADVTVLTEHDTLPHPTLSKADIVVSGTGVAHLIQPEHLKEGVLVFDAGTSEDGGELVGDVAPEVAKQAGLFTPVPGGIGPLTVACLLRNTLELAIAHTK